MTHSKIRPSRGRSRLLAAIACSALVLTACGSGTNEPDDSTAATTGVTVPVTPVTAQIVDAGAEPRSVLTPTPTPGETQDIDVVTLTKVMQQIDDQAQQDFSTPELTLPLAAAATDSGDGNSKVTLTIGTATSADPRLTDALMPTAGSTAGLTKDGTGAVTALHITPADAALDSARAAIEQAMNQIVYRSVSFPDDAIGVGAVWTLSQQVVSGITLNQVTTVTLREREGTSVTVDVSIEQTPESTVWNLPDNSGSLDIASYVMKGAGTLTLDTSKPLPTGGDITTTGDQVYTDPNSTTVLRQSTSDTIHWDAR